MVDYIKGDGLTFSITIKPQNQILGTSNLFGYVVKRLAQLCHGHLENFAGKQIFYVSKFPLYLIRRKHICEDVSAHRCNSYGLLHHIIFQLERVILKFVYGVVFAQAWNRRQSLYLLLGQYRRHSSGNRRLFSNHQREFAHPVLLFTFLNNINFKIVVRNLI